MDRYVADYQPPSQNGSASQFIPVQFRSTSAEAQAALAGPHGQEAAAYISLQNQFTETQTSLAGHFDRIRDLETQAGGHDATRQEVVQLRQQMEDTKREMELVLANTRGRQRRAWSDDDEEDEMDDDEDDTKSVSTVTANDDSTEARPNRRKRLRKADLVAQNADLTARIENLTAEMSEIAELSRSLKVQHSEALSAVETLAARIGTLEAGYASRVAEEVNKTEQKWEQWRAKYDEAQRNDRESWEVERERLRGVVREWEEASRRAHEEVEDRELNEQLSDEDQEGIVEMDSDWKGLDTSSSVQSSSSRKNRRRRPSHRAALAINALKSVADGQGSATPKQAGQGIEMGGPRREGFRSHTPKALKSDLTRSGSASTLKAEQESSESGKESGDTVQEHDVNTRLAKSKFAQVSEMVNHRGQGLADVFLAAHTDIHRHYRRRSRRSIYLQEQRLVVYAYQAVPQLC